VKARDSYDAVIVGGGHNGLVAATLLGRAGLSVLVLERCERLGGAAISSSPFAGVGVGAGDRVGVRLSRYAYLVSLFPREQLRTLGVDVELRRRPISSYTPDGDSGLLVADGTARSPRPAETASRRSAPVDAAAAALSGRLVERDPALRERWQRFYGMVGRVAARVFPTLTSPLLGREEFRRLVADDEAWEALFEQPLSSVLEETFSSDLVRGVVLTDATIGTFAPADDPALRQNRCFLYHLIGNGTGHWDVPVGGMGALSEALERSARGAGAEIRIDAEVVSIATDGRRAEVACAGGEAFAARHVLANVAPSVLGRLLGEDDPPAQQAAHARDTPHTHDPQHPRDTPHTHDPQRPRDPQHSHHLLHEHDAHHQQAMPEGSQLKINMLLGRLPRLRDPAVTPEQAFAGTFHVNESYSQLQRAYDEAAGGRIPSVPPCELYCHSLTDPSILSAELRAAGAQTLTLFGLHMPARLFGDPATHAERKAAAVAATLASLNDVLAEPVEDCLWRARGGTPCIEALTPTELEAELGMPGGHIFHRDLAWPLAETDEEIGKWGVETAHANVWLCGAGARRGGGVSGIPGYNVARAVLAARSRT
jgi:phytoene dehydrogenase-like protein